MGGGGENRQNAEGAHRCRTKELNQLTMIEAVIDEKETQQAQSVERQHQGAQALDQEVRQAAARQGSDLGYHNQAPSRAMAKVVAPNTAQEARRATAMESPTCRSSSRCLTPASKW